MGRPTFLLQEDAVSYLDSIAVEKVYFQDLTGVKQPWDVEEYDIELIREDLELCEAECSVFYPAEPLLPFSSGDTFCWLNPSGMGAISRQISETTDKIEEYGATPLWRTNTAEMLVSHLRNLKRMVLLTAYDPLLLDQFREGLGDQFRAIEAEFEAAEQIFMDMMKHLRYQDENITYSLQDNLIILNRFSNTLELIHDHQVRERNNRSTSTQLNHANAIFRDTKDSELSCSVHTIRYLNGFIREELRKSEILQLYRANRWNKVFSTIQHVPRKYAEYQKLIQSECRGFGRFVQLREEELGNSTNGQHALNHTLFPISHNRSGYNELALNQNM